MAGWAEEASLAAERNCDAMPALAAFVTGSAFPRISALQKSLDRMSDNAPVITVVFRVETLIVGLKIVEM